MGYYIGVLRLICINLIEVTGFVLLAGWTGIFSLGHAGFVAIGAYTCAFLTLKCHIFWPLAVLLAGFISGGISWLIGKPTLKLKSGYFAIASMGFGESIRLIIENVDAVGGARGLAGIPNTYSSIYSVLVYLLLGLFIMIRIRNSRFGRKFFAVRDDALAAEAMGIDTARVRETALFISAVYCGVGGALYGSYMTYLQPAMFNTDMSSTMSTWVVFGGLGSLSGGLIATAVLTILTESFRAFSMYRMFFYGLALVIIIRVRPQGLLGSWELTPDNLRQLAASFRHKWEDRRQARNGGKR